MAFMLHDNQSEHITLFLTALGKKAFSSSLKFPTKSINVTKYPFFTSSKKISAFPKRLYGCGIKCLLK